MPTPEKGEKRGDYIVRCMGYDDLQSMDSDQRMAVCNTYWNNYQRHGSIHGKARMSRALQGAEILEVGEWNDIEFTNEDLEVIVDSFRALGLKGRVPLKFGHNDEQPVTDGQPALGWVQRVYKQGSKLLADFSDMPAAVFEAVKSGMYKFVSVELLRDVKAGNRSIPWVLDAVALLGADPPAVGTLKDLQALTMSRMPRLEHGARLTFRRDHTTGDSDMADDSKKELEELRAKLARADRENEELKAKQRKDEDDAKKEKVNRRRASIKEKFDRAVEAFRILPRSRERFERIYRVDNDDSVTSIEDKEVDSFIKECEEYDKTECAKLKAENDAKVKATAGAGRKGADEVETGRNDEVFMRRVEKQAVAMGFKATDHAGIDAATKVVLKRDKKLAKAYLNNPSGEYKPDDEQAA